MSNLNVLIVGASIAGPTAAYWFAKAGAKVTIIERFPHLRTNGQNVDIRTVGVAVMRKMAGMEEAVRSNVTLMEGFKFVDANGKTFASMKATGDPDRQSLVSEYEIIRGKLARVLYDMTKDNENVKYVFGEQVVSMRQQQHQHQNDDGNDDDGPITVEFANGFPTSDFDLVVACDGATSRTRAIGLGCSVQDYTTPLNWWAAYFSVQEDLLGGSLMGEQYSAPGGRFTGVGYDPATVKTQITFMGIHPGNDHDMMQQFRSAQKEPKDKESALKQFIAQHYRRAGWKCDQIVSSMMESEDFYANEAVHVKLPSLYKGRFVLVGDAGYASSLGSGTSLALAGAYVLAGEVCQQYKKSGNNSLLFTTALKAYEQRMRPMIDEYQKIPPFITSVLAPQTAWGLWLRNCMLAVVSWSRVMEFAPRVFGGVFARSEKFQMPDYEWE